LVCLTSCVALVGCEKLPNIPPEARFVFTPVSPIYAGQTSVLFNASLSRDSDGSITSYLWNFGDGTGDQTAQGPTQAHVFPRAGACIEIVYTVVLTVADNKGESTSTTNTITVTQVPSPGSTGCPAN